MSSSLILKKKGAWVLVIWGLSKYLIGALTTAFSLKNVKTKYPIILMVADMPDFKNFETICNKVFDSIVHIDLQRIKTIPPKTQRQKELYAGYFQETVITKWSCLLLKEYEKVCFLDSDIIFQHSADELFKLNAPAGCFSTPFMKPYAHKGGIDNPYGILKHGQEIKPSTVLAGLKNSSSVNGSIVLLEPNVDDFKRIMKMVTEKKDGYGHPGSYSTVDEQAISEYYACEGKTWSYIHQIFEAIPWKWNWLPNMKPDLTRLIGLHYYHDKPWIKGGEGELWDDTKIWWYVFVGVWKILDSKEKKLITDILGLDFIKGKLKIIS